MMTECQGIYLFDTFVSFRFDSIDSIGELGESVFKYLGMMEKLMSADGIFFTFRVGEKKRRRKEEEEEKTTTRKSPSIFRFCRSLERENPFSIPP